MTRSRLECALLRPRTPPFPNTIGGRLRSSCRVGSRKDSQRAVVDESRRGKINMAQIVETGGVTASSRTDDAPNPAAWATGHIVGVLLAAVAAVAFSLRAVFVKLAYEDMSDPVTLLAL